MKLPTLKDRPKHDSVSWWKIEVKLPKLDWRTMIGFHCMEKQEADGAWRMLYHFNARDRKYRLVKNGSDIVQELSKSGIKINL